MSWPIAPTNTRQIQYKYELSICHGNAKFHWSVNEITNQPTITRKENYANGKWSEVPTNLVLPDPPISWLKPKIIFNEEEFVGTSTKKIDFVDEKNTCGDSCKESNSENESSDSGYYDY